MTSAEDFVDNAVAALRAGLGAALTAIEEQYADGPYDVGPLPRPRLTEGPYGFGDFYPGGIGEVLRYPTIEVAIPDLSGQAFSLDQHDDDQTSVCIVRAWLNNARFDHLYRTCTRYGAAMHNVLCDFSPDAERGCGFGEDVTIKSYRAAWRFNPERNERDEVTSAVLLAYQLDTPDLRP